MTENIPAATDELTDLVDVMVNAQDVDATTTSIAEAVIAAGYRRRLSPPTQEALAKFIRETSGYNLALIISEGEADFIAEAILSRFAVQPEPAEVEYGILHEGFDEWGTTTHTFAEAEGLLATEPCGDCVIVQRTTGREPGPWVPVEVTPDPGTLAYAQDRAEADGSLDDDEDGYDGPIPVEKGASND